MRFANAAVAALCFSTMNVVSGQSLPAFQSGPSVGNTYAGGLTYDTANQVFYATGATYQPSDSTAVSSTTTTTTSSSSCFVTLLSSEDLTVQSQSIYDDSTVVACNGIAVHPTMASRPGTDVLVIAVEDRGDHTTTAGSVFTTDLLAGTGAVGAGYTLDTDPATYPISVATDGTSVFVASMTSDDLTLTQDAEGVIANGDTMPNWTSGGIKRYGSAYSMTIDKRPKPGVGTDSSWTVEYSATGEDPSIYVGGILAHETGVYVVGSTRGSGDAVGGDADGLADNGFITKLSAADGSLVLSTRIQDDEGGEDIVTNVCDDPSDPSSIFIVGGAKDSSSGALVPAIARVSTESLAIQWAMTLEVSSATANTATTTLAAYGLSCEVDADVVYVAGQVGDGTVLSGAASGSGNDVFVAQLQTDSGAINWIQELGTEEGQERLSQGNGLTVDGSGNAVLFGHTNGQLFRSKTDTVTDIFAVTFSRAEGQHQSPTVTMPTEGASGTTGGEVTLSSTEVTSDATVSEVKETDAVTSQQEVVSTTPNSIFDETQLGTQIEGPIYAGGLAYSATANKVYFTGALYNDGTNRFEASDCFLGELNLSDSTTKLVPMGEADVPEACSALSLAGEGGNDPKAYMIGNTELGGLNSNLADPATASSIKQFGNVLEVLLGQPLEAASWTSGYLIGDKTVTYPVAVVAEPGNENVFVASLASDDGSETADNTLVEQEEYPDLTSGGLRRFGFRYYLRFTKVNLVSQTVADENFVTDDGSSVYASGVAIVGNYVFIVGSTRGSGGVFGSKEGADMDGFVLRLGDTLGDTFGWSVVNNARINSSNSQDDWITQICSDPNDGSSFYMVGATMGMAPGSVGVGAGTSGSISPIVVKMSADTMAVEWWTQLDALHAGSTDTATDATAFGCTVSSGSVYVAGIVKDGASIVSPDTGAQASMGMDDLFVAKVAAFSGTVDWARQFGTSKNEGMGKGGSVTTDGSGNVVLLGQTEGTLYSSMATTESASRRKLQTGVSDLIVLSVSPAGAFRTPMDEPTETVEEPVPEEPAPVEPAPIAPEPAAPVPAPEPEPTPPPEADPSPAPVEAPVAAPVEAPTKPAPSATKEDNGENNKLLPIIISTVAAVLILCCLCVICIRAKKRSEDRANQRKMLSIFKYLHAFDVDDIDIRRSPAGGYHGTYLNDLAHGENATAADEETAPGSRFNMSHASVADDYMFMSKRTISTNDDDNDSQTGLSTHL